MGALPPASELALIVHDMVNDRVKPGGKHEDAGSDVVAQVVGNCLRVLEACRALGVPVFFTRHALRHDYKDAAFRSAGAQQGGLKAGTWATEIIDDMEIHESDWLVNKGGGYSAFTGTGLQKWLRRAGTTTLIIVGAGTNSGIASTVFDARDRDIASIVVSDACAGAGGVKYQEAALLVMSRFADVMTADELLSSLPA